MYTGTLDWTPQNSSPPSQTARCYPRKAPNCRQWKQWLIFWEDASTSRYILMEVPLVVLHTPCTPQCMAWGYRNGTQGWVTDVTAPTSYPQLSEVPPQARAEHGGTPLQTRWVSDLQESCRKFFIAVRSVGQLYVSLLNMSPYLSIHYTGDPLVTL